MHLAVGDVGEVPDSPKKISHSKDTLFLANGEVVEYLGFIFKWDQDCVSLDRSLEWRTIGDYLCDEAIFELFRTSSASTGVDLLTHLQSYAEESPGGYAQSFLREVSQRPPAGVEASFDDIRLAQSFFLDHSEQIMQALLHGSLVGGFASHRIVQTLHSVSYLVPHSSSISVESNDRTYIRLLETFQFVLEVMGCTRNSHDDKDYLLPGGEGWKSIVKVRMLHSVVRRKTRERWNKLEISTDHMPISQEELSATLASFSIVPLWALKLLGLSPPPEHARAYLKIWVHIGFYLGISPSTLQTYFSDLSKADKFLVSSILHLFTPDDATSVEIWMTPTIPILRAVSNRPPLGLSFEYCCAISRHLLGSEFSDHLNIPASSTTTLMMLRASLFVQKITILFTRYYPRTAWLTKRRYAMRETMVRSIRFNLGRRTTTFRPRSENENGSGGLLSKEVFEIESVPPDPAGANLTVQLWKQTIWEMCVVCSVLLAVATWVCWKLRS